MRIATWLGFALLVASPGIGYGQEIVSGLKNPESVTVSGDGKIYVSQIGEFDKDGDGSIVRIYGNKIIPFCKDLNDPKGLDSYQKWLFVTDKTKVLRIDDKGQATVFADSKAFPNQPQFLNDLVVDPESGTVYVSDSGDLKGKGGVVYRITPQGKVSVLIDQKNLPELNTPNGLVMDGKSFLLCNDFGTGNLYRINIAKKSATKIADGFDGSDGMTWDMNGQLFISSWKTGKVFGIHRPGQSPVLVTDKFKSAADLCFDRMNGRLLVPDMKEGKLIAIPQDIPGHVVDRTPLGMKTVLAFPDLKLSGWSPENEKGLVRPLRPIVLTHAGDGSNRIFLATQRGVIHVFPNDPKVTESKVFLDIEKLVLYRDDQNEQGLLGLAFHPDFQKNGEFFVFYSIGKAKLTNVLSRFRVSKDDPNRADPNSEEELFRIERPFWNHDGGTIAFGPDGFLYVAIGDGGAANDPFNNGQNLKTLLGSIMRIDVDRKENGMNYAIPKDNPFVGQKNARPEIWAYGFRNIWRMAFDKKTGTLWGSDVGQNLYEEIDLIKKGGNYGWKLREGLHPFSDKGVDVRKDLIDPIWEYHHDVGKSITGGYVYRGKELPELAGAYIYGDYVTGLIWALTYDNEKGRVVANRLVEKQANPILSFGEDENGEIYMLTTSVGGKGVYKFEKGK